MTGSTNTSLHTRLSLFAEGYRLHKHIVTLNCNKICTCQLQGRPSCPWHTTQVPPPQCWTPLKSNLVRWGTPTLIPIATMILSSLKYCSVYVPVKSYTPKKVIRFECIALDCNGGSRKKIFGGLTPHHLGDNNSLTHSLLRVTGYGS